MSSDMPKIEPVIGFLKQLQDDICNTFEAIDGLGQFVEDKWDKPNGGGGRSRVLKDGGVFEQGGVNFSHVFGQNMPASATAARPELANAPFQAAGVSVVMHPKNPFVPTSHANVRVFMAQPKGKAPIWWFGGGFDLTPYFGFEEDCIYWHQQAKKACDGFSPEAYDKFKPACDDYFYLKHRQEARGIGGIFFDDLNTPSFDKCFELIQNVGQTYHQAYSEIVNRRRNTPFEQKHRDFQLYRRGRYVEFNLVYDRGTLFGLQSSGRTESILMSMPPLVAWEYCRPVEPGSEEAALYDQFLPPKDWLSHS